MEDYVAGSSQEEEDPAFVFTVMEENEEGVSKVSTARHESTMNVNIDGIVQEVLIDSGSVSNLMGKRRFSEVEECGFQGEPRTLFKEIVCLWWQRNWGRWPVQSENLSGKC